MSRAEAVKFISNIKEAGAAEILARPATSSDVTEIRAMYKEMFEK